MLHLPRCRKKRQAGLTARDIGASKPRRFFDRAVFVCRKRWCAPLRAADVGGFAPAGSYVRSVNLHQSAHPFDSG